MKERFHLKRSILAAVSIAAILTGCSAQPAQSSQQATAGDSQASASQSTQVRKIKYAFTNTLKPVSYLDENGKPAGYDVEVIKKIDEMLPQYEIEFVGTTSVWKAGNISSARRTHSARKSANRSIFSPARTRAEAWKGWW